MGHGIGELAAATLLAPAPLAFALGVVARLGRTEFRLPKDIYVGLSVYLLWSLGLQGGVELRHAGWGAITYPALATIGLAVLTPVTAYLVLRHAGRFSVADSAGIAAHYGSTSAVTFIAASTAARAAGLEPEGFMPTLLALIESPGIHIALAIGALGGKSEGQPAGAVLREVLTARTMVLLMGGLVVGYLMREAHWTPIAPFFDARAGAFKAVLTIFMLEMGLLAGERLGDLRRVGLFLTGFATVMPAVFGVTGTWFGHLAGLSPGGAAVLGTMAASASYIAAPPAVRVTLPEANPTYSLTAALAVTFPFNLLVGIPLYLRTATWLSA